MYQDKSSYRKKCYRCFRPIKTCYCHYAKPFHTNTRFIILMHPNEAYRQKTSTGYLSHITLQNSEIIIGDDFTHNKKVNDYINDEQYFPVMLYPKDDALSISDTTISENIIQKKRTLLLFIIDGTWYFAKKIIKNSKNMHVLPTLSFTTNRQSQYIFKRQPEDYCLSTIESIYYFIDECNHYTLETCREEKENLMYIFKKMVTYQIAMKEKYSKN